MRILRGAVVAALVCAAVSGQRVINVFSFRETFAAREGRGVAAQPAGEQIERLASIVTALVQGEAVAAGAGGAAARRSRTIVQANGSEDALLVAGTQATMDLVAGIQEQLGKVERRELVVQASWLTLPRKLATAHGIPRLEALPVDEATAGKLIKEAVQAKGTLRNLPEGKVEPLVTFALDVARPGEAREGKPQPIVRGEALLLRDDEAAFAMRVGWPQAASGPVATPQREVAFRLKAGAGVMLMGPTRKEASEDEEVLVLWVRFAGVSVSKPEAKGAETKPRGP